MLKAHKLKITVGLTSLCLILVVSFGIAWKSGYFADQIDSVPLAPSTPIAIDNDNQTNIELGWIDNSNNEDGFRIQRSMSIWHPFETIATLPANTISYTDQNNFVAGQRYYYKIIAFNSAGDSMESRIITPTREEPKDYLAGTGEFEASFITNQQRYSAPGSGVSEEIDSVPENSVANNWMGISVYNLNAGSDYFYRIADGGVAGSKQQCFAVKSNSQSYSKIYLRTALRSGIEIKEGEYSNGDTIKFMVDKISFQDADGLPAGVTKDFRLSVFEEGVADGSTFDSDMNGSTDLNALPTRLEAEYPVEVAGHPEATVNSIYITFTIEVNGSDKLGSKSPGICLDGAHFYVKKAGQGDYTSVTVPNREEHIQKSYLSHATSNKDDPYYIAQNYDIASMAYSRDLLRVPAKYFNPNLKFLLYTARSISDYRLTQDDTNDDASLSSENKIAPLLINHPEWFIPYDPSVLTPPSGDNREVHKKLMPQTGAPLNFVFDDYYQTEYMVNFNSQEVTDAYIDWWKTETAKQATKRGFDGIFIDVSSARQVSYDKTPAHASETCAQLGYTGINEVISYNPTVTKEKCVVFDISAERASEILKPVISYFRQNGFVTSMNCGGCHLGQQTTDCFFDPTKALNTPSNTPDSHFQEHSFAGIRPRDGLYNHNYYRDIAEWNNIITDMQGYKNINNNLPESLKKDYYVSIYGYNKLTPDPSGDQPYPADPLNITLTQDDYSDPSKYDNGWANFVIASYLMGSNDHTYLSITYDDYDLSTEKMIGKEYPLNQEFLDSLGHASADRLVQYQGQSYQYSDSALESSGNTKRAINYRTFENGLAVVNADKDSSHDFRMPKSLQDEYGRIYKSGSTIALQPHSGRLFFSLPAPQIHIISPTEGATTKSPSVTVQYLVDGVIKEKNFDLSVGENSLSIIEANEFESSITSTVNFIIHRSDSIVLTPDRFASGWNMSSLPDIEEPSPLVDILPDTFKARVYNIGTNKYDKFEDTRATPALGQGYWLKVDDTAKANAIRYSFNARDSITTPVSKGWNLLGNPFQADLPLTKLSVKYKDGSSKSFSDTVISKDISGYAWSYEATANPKQYYFISNNPNRYRTLAHKQTYISPFRGFWIVVKSDKVESIVISR